MGRGDAAGAYRGRGSRGGRRRACHLPPVSHRVRADELRKGKTRSGHASEPNANRVQQTPVPEPAKRTLVRTAAPEFGQTPVPKFAFNRPLFLRAFYRRGGQGEMCTRFVRGQGRDVCPVCTGGREVRPVCMGETCHEAEVEEVHVRVSVRGLLQVRQRLRVRWFLG